MYKRQVLNDLSVDIVIGNDRKHDLVRLLDEYSLDSVNDLSLVHICAPGAGPDMNAGAGQSGPDMNAGASNGADEDVIDADFKEV